MEAPNWKLKDIGSRILLGLKLDHKTLKTVQNSSKQFKIEN